MKYGIWYVNGGYFDGVGSLIEDELSFSADKEGRFETLSINSAYRCLAQVEKWRDKMGNISDWKWEVREKE